ncbi:hypothetical protein P154DRAFT_520724 [Amniculicola lignicola CBS 123094]|uniref:Uncharacterized protein n=1 Tax=Amniculicola lignicola CBS 123094 TaxID=1392246 RepID=A0A6A5WNI4_9PLEO|nr:hypothetical protein P154DRAFT_520724 [Amniculicola lignicola CBS 123094]
MARVSSLRLLQSVFRTLRLSWRWRVGKGWESIASSGLLEYHRGHIADKKIRLTWLLEEALRLSAIASVCLLTFRVVVEIARLPSEGPDRALLRQKS